MAARPTPDRDGAGAETRDRIIEAARRCLQEEGIAGASARAIARYGEFNQALIFYHFGSVDGLFQATAREDSDRRAALYADRLRAAGSLTELMAVGRKIHEVETAQGSTAVLTQLLAGSVSSPTLRAAILDGMASWTALVTEALAKVVEDTPLASVVPLDDLAFAISSLFLGMEMIGGLDAETDRATALFDSLAAVSGVLDMMLGSTAR